MDSFSCSVFSHSTNTPRGLANGGAISSTQGTNGLLPDSLRAVTAGGLFAANTWHRFGWNTGTSSHGGTRIGFSADCDSSDSKDSYIGMGNTAGSYGSWEGGAGYLHFPWSGAPDPRYAGLKGQIWTRNI